jgi:hypothetical protein
LADSSIEIFSSPALFPQHCVKAVTEQRESE